MREVEKEWGIDRSTQSEVEGMTATVYADCETYLCHYCSTDRGGRLLEDRGYQAGRSRIDEAYEGPPVAGLLCGPS